MYALPAEWTTRDAPSRAFRRLDISPRSACTKREPGIDSSVFRQEDSFLQARTTFASGRTALSADAVDEPTLPAPMKTTVGGATGETALHLVSLLVLLIRVLFNDNLDDIVAVIL